MPSYFLKNLIIAGGTAPSDSNDGLDPIGFGFTDATYVDSTKTLTKASGFTSYVFNTGDQIYIVSGTSVNAGLYTIASKTDNSNIVISTSIGSDSAGGDIVTSTGPWLTLQKGATTAVAGDTTVWCADADWTPSTVTWNVAQAASPSLPKRVTGATARGLIDSTVVNIRGDNIGVIFTEGGSSGAWAHTSFHFLDVVNVNTGTSADGWRALAGQNPVQWIDCKFHDCGGAGIHMDNLNNFFYFLRCEFYGNGDAGLDSNTAHEGHVTADNCSWHDNGGNGIQAGRYWLRNCLIYNNGNNGIRIHFTNSSGSYSVLNCTIYGNGGDGIQMENSITGHVWVAIRNNIIMNNGGFGINYDDDPQAPLFMGPNVILGNTAGATSIDGVAALGVTALDLNNTIPSIDTNPNFRSVADGAEDFRPELQSVLFTSGETVEIVGGAVGEYRANYMGCIPPDITPNGDFVSGGGHMIGG